MRTKQVNVYQFSELSDAAKERARSWFRSCCNDYGWGHENLDSLMAFADWFRINVRTWSLGGSDNRSQGVEFSVAVDDAIGQLRGVRLWKWLNNQLSLPDLSGNCPFTGYCFDEVLLDGVREFLKRPWNCNYHELMQHCIDAFCKAYAEDVDYAYSDEVVDETLGVNGYEFLENGELA